MSILGIDASRAAAARKTGTEWYAYHVIEELKKIVPERHRVILYSAEPLEGESGRLPRHWENLVLAWPPRRLWTQARLSWEMFRRPPDVLFAPAHTLPLICPEKTATVIHDVAFMAGPEWYGFFERLYHRWAARWALWRADSLLTVSEFSKREISAYFGAAADEIAVAHLGADAACRPVAAPQARETAARYGVPKGKPYFLFVGRLERKKNIAGLLRAFEFVAAKHSDAYLLLVGKRGFGFDESLSGADRVVEAGYVCAEDVPALYSGAIALVFPSWYEGFGIPVLEAWACGTPVIAAEAGSLPEVAGAAALFADPGNPEAIALAMSRLLGDPSERAHFARLGAERLKEFSWKKTAEAVWRALEPLLEK